MSVHAVQCAKRWDLKSGYIDDDGATVVVDDEQRHSVNHDGHILRVKEWTYYSACLIETPGFRSFERQAFIEAWLPMENGAELYVSWNEAETVGVSLGRRDTQGRWQPLAELDEHIALCHAECRFGCGLCLDYILEDSTDESPALECWTAAQIERAWRRIAAKPIIERPARHELVALRNQNRGPYRDAVDRAVRAGRTVTLDEYNKTRS